MLNEQIVEFPVEDVEAPGILHAVEGSPSWVVIIVVGGPQYRVGSHRQFVLAGRTLSAAGIAVLRFDYRGMGDASGGHRDFLGIEQDITQACNFARQRFPHSKLCLYGLCDGASAIAMWMRKQTCDAAILINPWVYQENTAAATRLESYYLKRLTSRDFWSKLLRFKVNWRSSAKGLGNTLSQMTSASATTEGNFIAQMLSGLQTSNTPVMLLLSGNDLTAEEFNKLLTNNAEWSTLVKSEHWVKHELESADHTFSDPDDLQQAHDAMINWLETVTC